MLLQIAEAAQLTQTVTKELLEQGATTNPTADPSGSLLVMTLIVGGVFFMLMSGALVYVLVSGGKKSAPTPAPISAPAPEHSRNDALDWDLIKTLTRIEGHVINISNHLNERVRH